MKPIVCIVILTYNRKEVLGECILSLLKNTYSNYIIVVVDNASTDGTSEMVKNQFPFIRLIRTEINLGYTGGNNVGIVHAIEKEHCHYVLIINDDVVVEPNFLNELIYVAEKDPKNGIANPMILSFENQSKLCNSYGKYNFYLGVPYQKLTYKKEPEEINLVRGTCFLIRKSIIKKIGLMDARFFLYFDEADLSYRIRKRGFKIMYVPSAKVYHKISESFSGKINPVQLYYSTRNELLFAREHLNLLVFIPLWIPRFFFRIIMYWLKSRDIEVIKYIIRGFRDFMEGKFGQIILSFPS